jgi:hypothetical protein
MTQAATAMWLGYQGADAVDQMNAEHDPLHRDLCNWLGLTSHSMRMAAGETLTLNERRLAALEEDAVLHVQRFRQMSR